MKTEMKIRPLLVVAGVLATCIGQAQVSLLGNNSGGTDYVGCDNTSPFPLRVMQNDNWPLQFWTDSLHRMQLFHTMPPATINGFPNIARNGYLGISPVEDFYTIPGPFSRVHLVDSVDNNAGTYAQEQGYRPWMRNGVTMTGNADQMYIGQKYTYVDSMDYESGEIIDRSDAVIEWSDNPDDSPWGTDRLRFMFTNQYNVAAPPDYGARSLEGMEAMRIYIPTDTTANVGVGDFFRAGVINGQNEDPTERLHVRDGRVRIQQLPDDLPADSDFVVMVVDTSAAGERGVVKWVPASSILSAADCEWSMTGGTNPGDNDVWTAVGAETDNCPDETEAVGIGTNNPTAKLHVVTDDFANGANIDVSGTTANTRGIVVTNTGTGTNDFGAVITATGATVSNQAIVAAAFGSGVNNVGANVSVNGGSASNIGVNSFVSGASGTNTGERVTVSGGTTANFGTDLDVSGPSLTNTALRGTVTGGTTSNVGGDLRVSGTSAGSLGLLAAVSGGTVTNTGENLTVSGASAVSTGEWLTVSGGTTATRGEFLTVTGTTGSATGSAFTVAGATGANTGLDGTVSGSAFNNVGAWLNVSGVATVNSGMTIRANDATATNEGINIRAGSTAGTVLNTGINITTTTSSQTSENRGLMINMSGDADRARGVEVSNNCTNSGGGSNNTTAAGFSRPLERASSSRTV